MPAKPSLPVTNHAVIRYLEHVAAVDIEAVRQRIHEDTKDAIAAGARGITANGITYKFKDGQVTTVWLDQCHLRPIIWPQESQEE